MASSSSIRTAYACPIFFAPHACHDTRRDFVMCSQGMLEVSWEAHATTLANTPDESVQGAIAAIADAVGVSASAGAARVLVARDTRPHSARLAALALKGVAHMGADCVAHDHGLLCGRHEPACTRARMHASLHAREARAPAARAWRGGAVARRHMVPC